MKALIAVAFLTLVGCASTPTATPTPPTATTQPQTPKFKPSFAVGQRVSFLHTIIVFVFHKDADMDSFIVNEGDTGVITRLDCFDDGVQYDVLLDKNKATIQGLETKDGCTFEAVKKGSFY